eukprot:565202-Pyramimonas_sp.AAC.1
MCTRQCSHSSSVSSRKLFKQTTSMYSCVVKASRWLYRKLNVLPSRIANRSATVLVKYLPRTGSSGSQSQRRDGNIPDVGADHGEVSAKNGTGASTHAHTRKGGRRVYGAVSEKGTEGWGGGLQGTRPSYACGSREDPACELAYEVLLEP